MSNAISTPSADQKVELLEEQVEVGVRQVDRARVVVETQVETRQHAVEAWLDHEEIQVERVPVGAVIEAVPPIREEDGVVIVPVVEERLVMRTELVLKEELRITRTAQKQLVRQVVPLRSEHATIRREELPAASETIEGEPK
ncbi:YsnF/AvaK domain-containing protein [Geminicoccus harenae]|uniref:YsnF/AvaK domain-containing protein n=1 Tax=Geminicoccus harenae TaxID=2498453 RepID=UPI00168BEB48|nr:DUF2382 domain-containing protein [Geminicoccus harenae]